MTNEEYSKRITNFMKEYCEIIHNGLEERWRQIPLELYDSEVYEVLGGLLARQTTLSIQLAENPNIWNPHIAPIILRSMIDAHITFAWILIDDFEKKAKQYILYGLGQEKKLVEHFKNELADNPDLKDMIEFKEKWIEAQRYPFLTEVNLGSWSGTNTRQMANDIGCESLYKFSFEPFSAIAHNMWQHIEMFNLKKCTNPLHKYHRVPTISNLPLSEDYVYRSSKYLNMSFIAFDKKFNLNIGTPMPKEWYMKNIEEIFNDEQASI